jgi:hypothetical protein
MGVFAKMWPPAKLRRCLQAADLPVSFCPDKEENVRRAKERVGTAGDVSHTAETQLTNDEDDVMLPKLDARVCWLILFRLLLFWLFLFRFIRRTIILRRALGLGLGRIAALSKSRW